MTRVVIDTNVFVSSFFGGNPRKIIDLWKTGRITLCLSPPIIDEYIAVLQRLGLDDGEELARLLAIFRQGHNCLFSANPPALRIVADDPDDDKFIACAVSLQCPFIISGDKHLLSVRSYMGIEIVNPRMFLEEIK